MVKVEPCSPSVAATSYWQDLLLHTWGHKKLQHGNPCMNSVWVKLRVFGQQRRWRSLCSCPPLLLEKVTGHSGQQFFINEPYKLVL